MCTNVIELVAMLEPVSFVETGRASNLMKAVAFVTLVAFAHGLSWINGTGYPFRGVAA